MKKQSTYAAVAMVVASAGSASAQQIWSGYDVTFHKLAFADHELPVSQDHITPNVAITRDVSGGIFNIAQESFYSGTSPADTEWAFGTTANWGALFYQPWVLAIGNRPPDMVGQPLVVHLISEDIYLDVLFTAWGQGPDSGGSFSYLRSIPAPSALSVIGLGGLAVSRRRR